MHVAHLTKKRQYNIIFGILLLLPIIDFALAAPIPAQGIHQTCPDVPGDVITLLNKRGRDDLAEKLTAYFDKWVDPSTSPNSLLPGSEHEPTGYAQTSISTSLGPEHGSTSDAQTSSSPSTGLDHGSMKVEQASGPTPSIANPNPLMEPPNSLSTEPSTYTPVSTVPSGYATPDYGSDGESTGTHVSQELYPHEWDFWLNPQDHVYQLDSSPPPEQQQQTSFSHWDDVQQQPPPLQNDFAHGGDGHQAQQDSSPHGQMDDAASTGSDYAWMLPELNSILDAFKEAHMNEADEEFRMYDYPNSLAPQQDEFVHEPQMDDVVPTGPSDHTQGPTLYGSDYGFPGTHEPQPPPPEYLHPWDLGDEGVHVHQPNPPQQGDDVARGTQ